MASLAIIPARGGSKRIPRKNIRDFLGKPILAYSIDVARDSGLFEEIMVSTEDDAIATLAISLGAKVPFLRSLHTADDYSTTADVLNEVINNYATKLNKTFNYVCCIYPTAPLASAERIKEGFKLLKERDLDTVFPVVAFGYPIWRGLEFDGDKIKMTWPEYLNSRSQDLRSVYHDAGQWYWFKPDRIKNALFTENSSSIILPEEEVQDIDNINDWRLAEMKFKLLHG